MPGLDGPRLQLVGCPAAGKFHPGAIPRQRIPRGTSGDRMGNTLPSGPMVKRVCAIPKINPKTTGSQEVCGFTSHRLHHLCVQERGHLALIPCSFRRIAGPLSRHDLQRAALPTIPGNGIPFVVDAGSGSDGAESAPTHFDALVRTRDRGGSTSSLRGPAFWARCP